VQRAGLRRGRIVGHDGGGESLFADRLQQHLRGQPVRVVADVQAVVILILRILNNRLDPRKP
jgi:hypothetical protein